MSVHTFMDVCVCVYRTCSIIRPPFLHRSSAKKKGGGRLIEVCTNAPNLRPPPPLQRGYQVTVYTARLMQNLVVAIK